jgi:ELWxxDGT repeat protein
LFFSTDRSGSNYDTLLWKSDGTSEGTTYVKKINESGQDNVSSYGLVCKNNTVFFSAYEPEHGQELWKSDGTLEGTVILKDIKTGTESGYPTNFVVFNDSIIFSANTSEHGQELWKSDGTTEGTVMIKDIYPGDNGSFPYSSSPNYIINTGDIFYFVANSADNGEELWKSDGTTEGTVMVKDVYPGYESGVYYLLSGGVIGDKFYFPANDNISGYELWQTDGTTANTTMVADIYTGSEGSHPSSFFNLNGQLIFVVNDGVYDYELWGISPDANYYTLSYFAGDGGTLTGSTTQSVLEGESGTDVTAVASSGYRFVRWSDNSTSNPRVDNNVSTDISVSAIFEIVNSKRSYGSYMPGYGPMINNSSENLVVASTEKTMPVNFTRNLKLKMRGIDVKDLQSYLNSKMNLNLKIDGIFGNLTRQAVIKFQIANNLVGDGIVGPLTRAKLK